MKIIIVGAGLIGTSTAYFLSRQGHEVHVFDRESGPAMETSFANGGMLTPSQAEPWNHPGIAWDIVSHLGSRDSPITLGAQGIASSLSWGMQFIRNSGRRRFYLNMTKNARLASYSMQVLRQIRRELEIHYDERCLGTLKFFSSAADYSQAIEHAAVYRQLDIKYQVLNAVETLSLEPALEKIGATIVGGIYYPDDESGDACKFCRSLAAHAEDGGVKFHYDTQVQGFVRRGNEIAGIATGIDTHTADRYILAAGSYSYQLARTVAIRLPVRPVKGYSITLDKPADVVGPELPLIDESRHIAMVPLGSRLRVAGTAELNGFNKSISPARVAEMLNYLRGIFPEIFPGEVAQDICAWSGLRPYSSDGVPYIGRAVFDNLYLNTGHGHLGWSMCAGSGKLLADSISDIEPDIDLQPYGYTR